MNSGTSVRCWGEQVGDAVFRDAFGRISSCTEKQREPRIGTNAHEWNRPNGAHSLRSAGQP
jgi:hypothetical protein